MKSEKWALAMAKQNYDRRAQSSVIKMAMRAAVVGRTK